jgi:hypothetical protein
LEVVEGKEEEIENVKKEKEIVYISDIEEEKVLVMADPTESTL